MASAAAPAPQPVDEYGAAHALYLDLADLNSVEAFAGTMEQMSSENCTALQGAAPERLVQEYIHVWQVVDNVTQDAALPALACR